VTWIAPRAARTYIWNENNLASEKSPLLLRKGSRFGTGYRETFPPKNIIKRSMMARRVAGLKRNRLLM
jgi:hypothetical protein